jgi:hypothetical protein
MPDGKEVVIAYGGKIHRVNSTSGEVRDIPFTAHVVPDLGPQLHYGWRVEQETVKQRNHPIGWYFPVSPISMRWICQTESPSGRRRTSRGSSSRRRDHRARLSFIDLRPHWFEIRRGVLDTQNWSFWRHPGARPRQGRC